MPRFEDLENAGLRVVVGGDGLVQSVIDSQGRDTGIQTGKIAFPNFAPRLLASLAASSTAECTSGVVTVTAAAHAIPATTFNGYDFYYPGSTSLSAGWYHNFQRTGVDTVTFSAPESADFASESVNGGAAVTTEITACSINLLPDTISVGDSVFLDFMHAGDGTTANKTSKLKLGTSRLSDLTITSATSSGLLSLGFCVPLANQQIGVATRAYNVIATRYSATEDISSSLAVSLTLTVSAAGGYIGVPVAKLRII